LRWLTLVIKSGGAIRRGGGQKGFDECIMCFEERKRICIVPCGHKLLCIVPCGHKLQIVMLGTNVENRHHSDRQKRYFGNSVYI
jgi:hypothetical protein